MTRKNYLVFQSINKNFEKSTDSNHILVWKSKGLSDESIKPPAASNISLALALNSISTKL